VSNGLNDYAKFHQTRNDRELLVTILQDRSKLAILRYKGGIDSMLNALDAERDLFNAQLLLTQARRNELLALVQLYKALGGGWQPESELAPP
jgi:multidrug efflux system outer membrane protein